MAPKTKHSILNQLEEVADAWDEVITAQETSDGGGSGTNGSTE